MKDYYKIHEISKLYGIGVDSLRYYERLGVIRPGRDVNGYRLYSLKDMYKLNIIRDLRSLGFSMKQIKEYLDGQNVAKTRELLMQEQTLIRQQQEELAQKEEVLKRSLLKLENAAGIQPGEYRIKQLPARNCVQLNQHITRDEEMDFAIKRLQRKYEKEIQVFGNHSIGAFLSMEDIQNGRTNVYNSVFFILEKETQEWEFQLPAGAYLSCYYRGEYEQNGRRIRSLLRYAREKELRLDGNPFEIYEVDNRYTVQPEEFVTEIQVKIWE